MKNQAKFTFQNRIHTQKPHKDTRHTPHQHSGKPTNKSLSDRSSKTHSEPNRAKPNAASLSTPTVFRREINNNGHKGQGIKASESRENKHLHCILVIFDKQIA